MKILLVGCLGNMGRRYAAILDYLGVEWVGFDSRDGLKKPGAEGFDAVIYATPTVAHMSNILDHLKFSPEVPMLVEKPIDKSMPMITLLKQKWEANNFKIMMVNQYRHLVSSNRKEPTQYDYFKSGGDGLAWDCINLIGLAQGTISLKNESPLWHCRINGNKIWNEMIDASYIENIKYFLNAVADESFNWKNEMDYIYEAHQKVHDFIEGKL